MAFKKNSVLAIDIGSSAIRVAEFFLQKGKVSLGVWGSVPISLEEESEASKQTNEVIIAMAFEKLIAQLNIPSKKVVHSIISIPGRQVGVKQISTVKLTDEELASSLLYEARKHLPVKGDEVLLDYQILQEKSETLDVLLTVTSRQTIEGIHHILQQGGIKPDIIDVPALAILNAILFSESKSDPKNRIVLHVGASVTHVSLHTKEGDFITREIPLAGSHFTDEIRKEKQFTLEEAEEYKLSKGVMDNGESGESQPQEGMLTLALASAGTNKAVESLARELQRSIRFFMKEANVESLDAAYFSGGSAADKGLKEHLEKELRFPLITFDPFAANNIETDIKEAERPLYTQLVGMGIRQLYELFSNQFK